MNSDCPTIHVEIKQRLSRGFCCDYSYVKNLGGIGRRFITVIGHDTNHFMDFDLIATLAKPTKRQLRKWKRKHR